MYAKVIIVVANNRKQKNIEQTLSPIKFYYTSLGLFTLLNA